MNKKILFSILGIIIIIGIVACIVVISNNSKTEQKTENKEEVVSSSNKIETKNTATNTGKALIVYFSLPEETGNAKEDSTITVNGEIIGNTQYVAQLINEKINSDMFRIIPVKEYNIRDHQALIDDAKEEQNQNTRPEIKDKINNFDSYNTIFIGYPIWWSDLPQILYTFLESYDFTNKNVYLFSTNGGSGLAGTVETITNKLSDAKVEKNAFKLHRNSMENAPQEVDNWLKELGF